MDYKIEKVAGGFSTRGLAPFNRYEVTVSNVDVLQEESAHDLLSVIGNYVLGQEIRIQPDEKISFGSWTLQLKLFVDHLEVFEYESGSGSYIAGAKFSMDLWEQQKQITQQHHSQVMRPNPGQMVVISDGVLEGEEVEGVRYPSPTHMSGWWVTTDQYSGDPKTLKTVHLVHLLTARPELGPLLALDYGFRFKGEKVWFDESVAREHP